jgi:hypothetical protein
MQSGRLDRSARQTSERRWGSLACRHRDHHRCAVAGNTANILAASRIDAPPSTTATNDRRPASPSFALPVVVADTANREARMEPSAVHNLRRHDI